MSNNRSHPKKSPHPSLATLGHESGSMAYDNKGEAYLRHVGKDHALALRIVAGSIENYTVALTI